jgi:hypothetical protein
MTEGQKILYWRQGEAPQSYGPQAKVTKLEPRRRGPLIAAPDARVFSKASNPDGLRSKPLPQPKSNVGRTCGAFRVLLASTCVTR